MAHCNRVCEVCGATFIARAGSARSTCSPAHRTKLWKQQNPGKHRENITRQSARARKDRADARANAVCVICAEFVPTGNRLGTKVCSEPCRRALTRANDRAWTERKREHTGYSPHRSKNAQRNAIRRGDQDAELISVQEVYSRGGSRCGICGEAVDTTLTHPDEASASLDHVVPMSVGGKHVLGNVHLTHLGCNRRRKSRPLEDVMSNARASAEAQ